MKHTYELQFSTPKKSWTPLPGGGPIHKAGVLARFDHFTRTDRTTMDLVRRGLLRLRVVEVK